MANFLLYQFEVNKKLSLFNRPVFLFFLALLRTQKSEKFSGSSSSYSHTQHFGPGKLTEW